MARVTGAKGLLVIRPAFGLIIACLVVAGCSTPVQTGRVVTTATASPTAAASPGASAACYNPSSSPEAGPTAQASPPTTTSPSGSAGAIAGGALWPISGVVPELIYALSTAGASHGAYSTETIAGQSSYTIKGVAPGEYFVFAAVRPLQCKGQGAVVGAAAPDRR